jgi:tetratricopeptide (TPR) repeat protein
LHELGAALRAVGRHEDALHIDEEVIQLRRELAAKNPGAFKDLVAALNDVGIALNQMGRPGEAVPYGEEAVRLCRKLAEEDPGPGGTSVLATSLQNLGSHLRASGRVADVLQVIQEAVDLRRTLAEVDQLREHLRSAVRDLLGGLSCISRNYLTGPLLRLGTSLRQLLY